MPQTDLKTALDRCPSRLFGSQCCRAAGHDGNCEDGRGKTWPRWVEDIAPFPEKPMALADVLEVYPE